MSIIRFIVEVTKDKNREPATKEEIARAIHNPEVCSRPTTLRIIKSLRRYGIIKDVQKRQKAYSRLVINPKYEFRDLQMTYLIMHYKYRKCL
jgi:hypothetical protein